jgi:hypothetical protein
MDVVPSNRKHAGRIHGSRGRIIIIAFRRGEIKCLGHSVLGR